MYEVQDSVVNFIIILFPTTLILFIDTGDHKATIENLGILLYFVKE